MKVGFARISIKGHDLNIQLKHLAEFDSEKIFHGKQSGVSLENDGKLNELVDFIREGDEVIVTRLDRLRRSLKTILDAIDNIHSKGAYFNIVMVHLLLHMLYA